jgi:hypothetical protein
LDTEVYSAVPAMLVFADTSKPFPDTSKHFEKNEQIIQK